MYVEYIYRANMFFFQSFFSVLHWLKWGEGNLHPPLTPLVCPCAPLSPPWYAPALLPPPLGMPLTTMQLQSGWKQTSPAPLTPKTR